MPARPGVLWFTGLSGSGTSTLAPAVLKELTDRAIASPLFDGDAIRTVSPIGFTRRDRDTHVRRVGLLASQLEGRGISVLCALISPYEAAREWVRQQCRCFVEIYVSTPLSECERRDPKGLYLAARQGRLPHLTGVDDPYEPPRRPDLSVDTSLLPLDMAVRRILDVWRGRSR